MKLSVVAVAVGLVASTAAIGLGQTRGSTTPSIEGVWEGVSSVSTGANAGNNPKRLPNFHIYTKGYYTVLAQDPAAGTGGQQPPRKVPPPLKTPGKPTDAEKIALYEFWAPITAITGTYEIKGNMLTQHPVVAKTAPGAANTIEFRLEDGGKTLVEIAKNAPGQPASEATRRYRRIE